MNEKEILEKMSKYNFLHRIKLTENITTPGNKGYLAVQDQIFENLNQVNFKDKKVLDIGCRDGLFSFYCEKKGASEIIAIDNDLSKAATDFLVPFFNSKVQFKSMNLYDLKKEEFGLFDIIIFAGTLYHLRYPFWALKVITDLLKEGGKLIIETAVIEDYADKSILFAPTGWDSPYEPSSCTFFNKKCMEDTLTSLGHKVEKVTFFKRNFKQRIKYFMQRRILHRTIATRSVISSEYVGLDKDNFLYKYWNKKHTFHNDEGG